MFDLFVLKKKYHKTKILLVDDEPNILITLQDRLEMNGYKIITANNGKEGLKKALDEKPDIILLDIFMPVMDGLEMLEELREHRECNEISVIMVTATSEPQEIARAEACGVDDYIVKPFDLSALIGKIENIIETKRCKARRS